jgi:hypothetical protein
MAMVLSLIHPLRSSPVKASVDAEPLTNYTGGVLWDAPAYESDHHNHVRITIVLLCCCVIDTDTAACFRWIL